MTLYGFVKMSFSYLIASRLMLLILLWWCCYNYYYGFCLTNIIFQLLTVTIGWKSFLLP